MSEQKQTEKRETPRKKIQLKGERPPGVIGEMHSERLLKKLRRWRTEGSCEEDERVWEQFEPSLRDSKARDGNASSEEQP
jgi:hypothetical protein